MIKNEKHFLNGKNTTPVPEQGCRVRESEHFYTIEFGGGRSYSKGDFEFWGVKRKQ